MAFLSDSDSNQSPKSYLFSVPHLIIGGAIALVGTVAIKLIAGVLNPKAR